MTEEQKIREEELAVEKEFEDLERKLEEELRVQELTSEARRIAEAVSALKQKITEER